MFVIPKPILLDKCSLSVNWPEELAQSSILFSSSWFILTKVNFILKDGIRTFLALL